MKNIVNPFSITSYLGPEYFCDRVNETEKMITLLHNECNVTLISPRKYGKTGLIKHVFNQDFAKNSYCFYLDLDKTSNLYDFVKIFGSAVLGRCASMPKRVMNNVLKTFSSLRLVFSADAITGQPQCMVDFKPDESEKTLAEIFSYLEHADKPCYVAFDEFQTIADYKDVKMEALLRSYIQHLTNVHFIFSGSKKHLMIDMFSSAARPFYQSTRFLSIDVIDKSKYFEFAAQHFKKHHQNLSFESFEWLYNMVHAHTWYVQALLNQIYMDCDSVITIESVRKALSTLIEEYKESYLTYHKLLSSTQSALLIAIAKEGSVSSVRSTDFIAKYSIPASSALAALESLCDKELVFEYENGKYTVYDRFFSLWMSQL
ncbi:MAG: ATP-binding protein [Paludibacteraceae bacterium]|nr:ATP-binding protein [Paludibacteraceae bacterium]